VFHISTTDRVLLDCGAAGEEMYSLPFKTVLGRVH
jgi:hypothetical protein